MTYPKACVACEASITEALYEFGDAPYPLCQSCWLTPIHDLYSEAIYSSQPIYLEGIQIGYTKHLTAFGVLFFDGEGVEGEMVARVLYGIKG